MKSFLVIVSALCAIAMVSSFKLNDVKRRETTERFIQYITTTEGEAPGQRVNIVDQEVELEMEGGIHVVLDYKQNLMTMKRQASFTVCMVTRMIDSIPSLEEIKAKVTNQAEFKYPENVERMTMHLAEDQSPVELSGLSANMCENTKVINVELQKVPSVTSTQLQLRPQSRPKREVGWGEIILIVIVVIILL